MRIIRSGKTWGKVSWVHHPIDESVDLLGFSFKVEACLKNNHRHIIDIGVFAYLRGLFFQHNEVSGDSERLGEKTVNQQAH